MADGQNLAAESSPCRISRLNSVRQRLARRDEARFRWEIGAKTTNPDGFRPSASSLIGVPPTSPSGETTVAEDFRGKPSYNLSSGPSGEASSRVRLHRCSNRRLPSGLAYLVYVLRTILHVSEIRQEALCPVQLGFPTSHKSRPSSLRRSKRIFRCFPALNSTTLEVLSI